MIASHHHLHQDVLLPEDEQHLKEESAGKMSAVRESNTGVVTDVLPERSHDNIKISLWGACIYI